MLSFSTYEPIRAILAGAFPSIQLIYWNSDQLAGGFPFNDPEVLPNTRIIGDSRKNSLDEYNKLVIQAYDRLMDLIDNGVIQVFNKLEKKGESLEIALSSTIRDVEGNEF